MNSSVEFYALEVSDTSCLIRSNPTVAVTDYGWTILRNKSSGGAVGSTQPP